MTEIVNGYVIGRFGMGGSRIIRRATKDEIENSRKTNSRKGSS